jgi:uncharacterized OB-fold protein
MYNVPDDWNLYYSKCHECGDRTHASENYACSCDDDDNYDNDLIHSKFVVCSKTAKIKYVTIYRDGKGGIKEEFSYFITDELHINRYLTPSQIKWRNNLLNRLKQCK